MLSRLLFYLLDSLRPSQIIFLFGFPRRQLYTARRQRAGGGNKEKYKAEKRQIKTISLRAKQREQCHTFRYVYGSTHMLLLALTFPLL